MHSSSNCTQVTSSSLSALLLRISYCLWNFVSYCFKTLPSPPAY